MPADRTPAPMTAVYACENLAALLRVRAFDPVTGRVELSVRERHAMAKADAACATVRDLWGFDEATVLDLSAQEDAA